MNALFHVSFYHFQVKELLHRFFKPTFKIQYR